MLDDILHLVLLNLSKSELSISSRVSRTWHALAQPILERRRVLKLYLFDSSDKVPWYEQRGRHQRDLIGTVRLENLRHLSLGRGDFHLGDAAIRNEDYTTIFDVVRAVSANLTTLWFASPLPRIDLTAFKFPPFPQLRRLTFCNGPVSEESDSTMNVLFPYLHKSTALTELWLPVLDNLEPLHLPSFLLRTLTLHRVEGILEEAAKEKFTALSYLKKLDWSFQLPPKNFALPTSVVELSLRFVGLNEAERWSLESAFPNLPSLADLSSLYITNCLPLSSDFPTCQFRLSSFCVSPQMEDEVSYLKLLYNSVTSLTTFLLATPSLRLIYLHCGGQAKHEVTYSDIFENLGSRLETLTIGSWNLDEEFVRLNNGSMAFAFHHLGDRMVEVSAVIAGLDDAITSKYLPALKSVSVQGTRLEKQTLESLKRLSAEYSFELVVVT